MGSSGGGGGDGGGMGMLMRGGNTPMPGLPIAGQAGSGANVDPYTYGQFQNFLPDIKAEGQNDMATGLRPDMFNYIKPGGGAVGGGGGGNTDAQIQELRDQLAKLQSGGGGRGQFGAARDPMSDMLPVGFNTMSPEQQQQYGGGAGFFNPGGWANGA